MPTPLPTLQARGTELASPRVQRQHLQRLDLTPFGHHLKNAGLWPLTPTPLEIFQVNVGRLCNQTCRHCHVDAGPDRRESMSRETMEQCLRILEETRIPTVDITGGAPEMNPNFRWFVQQCRALGLHVLDRCNLTIMDTPSHRDLPEFFAENQVEVVCSLPHYRNLATDAQRGEGVFEKSIRMIERLNHVGYGRNPKLQLNLVTNPTGAFLPASQPSLEKEWKRELQNRHGIQFNNLYTITNMPISRYLEWLEETDNLNNYMEKLVQSFNPSAAAGVMCRNTLSVGWDGTLYDCDFNQMLEMPAVHNNTPLHIHNFNLHALANRNIQIDQHCYGCTAGAGSSCGGSTTEPHPLTNGSYDEHP